MKTIALLALGAASVIACGGSAPDARYPARDAGCPVKTFPGDAQLPVDDLGSVSIDCASASGCERKLLDEVCKRGGDVAWGLADNAINAPKLVAHAAHSKNPGATARERGCAVQVVRDTPTGTRNIGAVEAYCDVDDKDACLRELEDQVCLLGGDVVWQVEGPLLRGDRKVMRGRAAHTR